ncbi:MAG: ATP-binding protein [Planctomycetota bacterium]
MPNQAVFAAAFHDAPCGLILSDVGGRILLANKAAGVMFRYDVERLTQLGIEDLVPRRIRDSHPALRELFFARPTHRAMGEGRDLTAVRSDGTEFPAEIGLSPIASSDELRVLTSIVDISSRRAAEEAQAKLEADMWEKQKLESLGLLAGGVAHDFNNLLLGVFGSADLALEELPKASPVRRRLEVIRSAGKRMAELAQQMLAYAGRGRLVLEEVDLNLVLRELVELLEVAADRKATIHLDLASGLHAIRADPSQIRQVLLNLITNAVAALEGRTGMVSIRTGNQYCDAAYLAQHHDIEQLEPGYYVRLSVSDTGKGMDPELQKRIFDPFFTTKPGGRGLGLAAVRGIMNAHGGAIRVYSEVGRGTHFKLLFPAVHDEATGAEPASAEPAPEAASLLLVDDDELARSMAADMLGHLGYRVVPAGEGAEALSLYQDPRQGVRRGDPRPHHAPHGRRRAVRAPAGRGCSLPIVIVSGYAKEEVHERFAGRDVAGFVQKPYSLTELKESVLEALGGG